MSEVLRLVKTRQEVVITERGKPIAKIVPFNADDAESLEQRVERLCASGQLASASVSPRAPLPSRRKSRTSAPAKDSGALQRFLADRDE